ncbi:MAG: hypothetical protein GY943_01355 [Chloroflexi bacterium]|nr:hypothetical protein [Chloroflexota bacterium]
MNKQLLFLVLIIFATIGCNTLLDSQQTIPSCADAPPFEQTIEQLPSCLGVNASMEEIVTVLHQWNRIDDEWGGVSEADVAVGGEQELIIRYHSERVALNTPQTRFAVLQRGSRQWHILFDDSIFIDNNSQWRSEVLGMADATGDGYADLLMELTYASRYFGYSYGVLLTSHPQADRSEIRVAFAKTNETVDGRVSFEFIDGGESQPKAIQSVEKFDYYHVITRTYAFNMGAFEQIEESNTPQVASDIPSEYQMVYKAGQDWHVYRCDLERTSGSSMVRICGMKSNGAQQQVLSSKIVSPVLLSPDKQWLVFAAPEEDIEQYTCGATLWMMSLMGNLTPLVSADALRICYASDLAWLSAGGKSWIQFHNWNGSTSSDDIEARPLYQVDIESGELIQD